MDRKGFLKRLFVGGAVIALSPQLLAESEEERQKPLKFLDKEKIKNTPCIKFPYLEILTVRLKNMTNKHQTVLFLNEALFGENNKNVQKEFVFFNRKVYDDYIESKSLTYTGIKTDATGVKEFNWARVVSGLLIVDNNAPLEPKNTPYLDSKRYKYIDTTSGGIIAKNNRLQISLFPNQEMTLTFFNTTIHEI